MVENPTDGDNPRAAPNPMTELTHELTQSIALVACRYCHPVMIDTLNVMGRINHGRYNAGDPNWQSVD